MAQTQYLGKTATSVFTDDDGFTKVVYHQTVVVRWDGAFIMLNTGGWSSATTIARMNQASSQFKLGFNVTQTAGKDGRRYVTFKGQTVEFNETVSLRRSDGSILSDIKN